MKSIMQIGKECYICGSTYQLEEHHVFGGCRRQTSEKYGLKVYLCRTHHQDPKIGVTYNAENMRKLQQEGQRAFERAHPDKNFLAVFGKNYL